MNTDRTKYLKWKRKNVTLRGMRELGVENGGSASLGRGLYTACLSNRAMARQYGKVYFIVGGIPQKPKVFCTLLDAENWIYKVVKGYCEQQGQAYSINYFYEHTSLEKEIMALGYDGIIIKGREMVHYNPENIQYYENERTLYQYYEYCVYEK